MVVVLVLVIEIFKFEKKFWFKKISHKPNFRVEGFTGSSKMLYFFYGKRKKFHVEIVTFRGDNFLLFHFLWRKIYQFSFFAKSNFSHSVRLGGIVLSSYYRLWNVVLSISKSLFTPSVALNTSQPSKRKICIFSGNLNQVSCKFSSQIPQKRFTTKTGHSIQARKKIIFFNFFWK